MPAAPSSLPQEAWFVNSDTLTGAVSSVLRERPSGGWNSTVHTEVTLALASVLVQSDHHKWCGTNNTCFSCFCKLRNSVPGAHLLACRCLPSCCVLPSPLSCPLFRGANLTSALSSRPRYLQRTHCQMPLPWKLSSKPGFWRNTSIRSMANPFKGWRAGSFWRGAHLKCKRECQRPPVSLDDTIGFQLLSPNVVHL